MAKPKGSTFTVPPLRPAERWPNALAAGVFLLIGFVAMGLAIHAGFTLSTALGDNQPVIRTVSALVAAPFMGITALGFGLLTLLHLINPVRANAMFNRVLGVSLAAFVLGLVMLPGGMFLESAVMTRHGYENCKVTTTGRGTVTWGKSSILCEQARGTR